MHTHLIRDTLGIGRLWKYKPPRQTDLIHKIHHFSLRDDVTGATAKKKETVMYKKKQVTNKILIGLDEKLVFLKENGSKR